MAMMYEREADRYGTSLSKITSTKGRKDFVSEAKKDIAARRKSFESNQTETAKNTKKAESKEKVNTSKSKKSTSKNTGKPDSNKNNSDTNPANDPNFLETLKGKMAADATNAAMDEDVPPLPDLSQEELDKNAAEKAAEDIAKAIQEAMEKNDTIDESPSRKGDSRGENMALISMMQDLTKLLITSEVGESWEEVATWLDTTIGTDRFKPYYDRWRNFYSVVVGDPNIIQNTDLSYDKVFRSDAEESAINLENKISNGPLNDGEPGTRDLTEEEFENHIEESFDSATKLNWNRENNSFTDARGNVVNHGDKSVNAHNSMAYLTQDFINELIEKNGESTVKKTTSSNDRIADMQEPKLLSPGEYEPGTPLTLRVAKEFSYVDDTGNHITWSSDMERDEMPIGIYNSKGKLIAFLHKPSWVTGENVAEFPAGNVNAQKDALTKLRDKVINEGEVKTTVTYKSYGKLIKNSELDNNNQPEMRRTSVAIQGSIGEFPMVIGKNGLPYISKGNLVKYNIINKDSKDEGSNGLKEGVPYIIAPTPIEGEYIALPVRNMKLGEEYAESILNAAEIFLSYNKGRGGQGLSEELENIKEQISVEYGIDLTTESGMNQYFSLFGYNSMMKEDAMKAISQKTQEEDKGRVYATIRSNGLFIAKDRMNTTGARNLEQLKENRTNIKKQLEELYISLRLDKSLDSEFKLPVIIRNKEGQLIVEDYNSGESYQEFMRKHTMTNLNTIEIEDGKYSVFSQPTIEFDSTFIPTNEEQQSFEEKQSLKDSLNSPEIKEAWEALQKENAKAEVKKQAQQTSEVANKLKIISERRAMATESDLKNSQLIKDIRVDKSQPNALTPNAVDNKLAAIMLYGKTYDALIGEGLPEEANEAKTLAYRILNDLLFDINEIVEFADVMTPEYAGVLTTNENPVKEFFENDIFELVDNQLAQPTSEVEGVSEIFNENPELASIGTKAQYSAYLNTVFPDSKIKDIVYHGTSAKFDEFKDSKHGHYFALDKQYPYRVTKEQGVSKENTRVIAVLLDSKSLGVIPEEESEYGFTVDYELGQEMMAEGYAYDAMQGYDTGTDSYVIVVKNKKQTHILGSKKDIAGFKEFVSKPTQTSEDVKQKLKDIDNTSITTSDINMDGFGEDMSITDIGEDPDIDLSPARLTKPQLEFVNNSFKGIKVKDFSVYKQNLIVDDINFRILSKLRSLKESNKGKITMDEAYSALLAIYSKTENQIKNPNLIQIVNNWDELVNISKLKLRTLGILSTQNEKGSDINTPIIITEETASELDEALEVIESNYEKTNYDDGLSFMIDAKNTMSSRLREFFAFTPSGEKNPITGGESFVPFDEVTNYLNALLSGENQSFSTLIAKLKEHKEDKPWINNLINKLEGRRLVTDTAGKVINKAIPAAPIEVQNEFVVYASKHYARFKRVLWEFIPSGTWIDGQWVQEYEGTTTIKVMNPRIRVIDSNQNAITKVIRKQWQEGLKLSSLTKVNKEGEIIIDGNIADSLTEYFNDIKGLIKSKNFDVAKPALDGWLRSMGVEMHPKALDAIFLDARGVLGMKLINAFESENGVFKRMNERLKSNDQSETAFNRQNPLSNNPGITKLSNLQARYDDMAMSNSHKNGEGKTVFSYSMNKALSHRVKDLKAADKALLNRLAKLDFTSAEVKELGGNYSVKNSNSRWLEMLLQDDQFGEKFNITYLDTLNKVGKTQGTRLSNMSPKEIEITKLGLFFNQGEAQFNTDSTAWRDNKFTSHFFMPTLSDKSTMPMITAFKFNPKFAKRIDSDLNKFSLDKITMSEMTKIARAEYTRVSGHQEKVIKNPESTSNQIDGYGNTVDESDNTVLGGANYFFMYPFLNQEMLLNEEEKTPEEIAEDAKLETLMYVGNQQLVAFTPEIQAAMDIVIHRNLVKLIQNKIDTWTAEGIVEKKGTKYNLKFIDATYQKNVLNQVYNSEVDPNYIYRTQYAAADFTLNYLIANANAMQLLSGDPAMFFKKKVVKDENGNVTGTNVKASIRATWDNIGKRLAKDIAPGYDIPIQGDSSDFYQQLFLNDPKGKENVSSNITEIKRRLKEEGIDSSSYEDIDIADAQEYTTSTEHIFILFKMGKLTQKEYDTIMERVSGGYKLNTEQLKKVLQPMKPVYVKNIIEDGVERVIYIKSSSFPLLPQLTRGLELDNLRKLMEGLDENNIPIKNTQGGEYGRNRIARASFQTAAKLGASRQVDVLNLTADNIEYHSTTLDRSGFRIQQELPFDESKDKITKGSQETKLLFVNLLDVGGFKLKGGPSEGISGKKLKEKYDDIHKELYEEAAKNLKEELTVSSYIILEDGTRVEGEPQLDMPAIQAMLIAEAKERGYSIADLQSLEFAAQIGESVQKLFDTPLWMNNSANKFESLLTSIVSNRVTKMKRKGFSGALGSEYGFISDTSDKGIELLKQSGIAFSPNFDAEKGLQPMREELNEKGNPTGKILPGQIFAPLKIKDNYGNIINIKDIIDENGKIDLTKVSEESLQIFGFRIPTQGLNSMTHVEIVGFLPYAMGDLIIASKDLVAQMGSDFDIDKLFAYSYNTEVSQEFKITEGVKANNDKLMRTYRSYLGEYVFSKVEGKMVARRDMPGFDEEISKKSFAKDTKGIVYVKDLDMFIDRSKTSKVITKIQRYNGTDSTKKNHDKLLDIQFAVLDNPDNKVQAQIKEPLEFGDLKRLVDLYGTARENRNEEFIGISDEFQKEVFFAGRSGQVGIGVFSVDSMFNAISQGKDMAVMKKNLNYDKDDPSNGPLYIENPISFKITNRDKEGEVAKGFTVTKSADLSGILSATSARYKSQIIEAFQSAAVDNVKEQILNKLNINATTFGAISALSQLGFEEKYSIGIIAQDSIFDLVKEVENLKDSTTSGFSTDPVKDAFDIIFKKYIDKIDSKERKEQILSEIEQGKWLLSEEEMTKSIVEGTEDGNYIKVQLSALKYFLKASSLGEQLQSIKSTVNTDSKHLPKSFLEINAKLNKVEELDDIVKISNASSLLGKDYVQSQGLEGEADPTTINGYATKHGLELGKNLFSELFPYHKYAITNILDTVYEITGKKRDGSQSQFDLERQVVNAMKSFIYSSAELGLFEGDLTAERNRLNFDEVRINVEESVVGDPRGEYYIDRKETTEVISLSLAARVAAFKNTIEGKRNALISNLNTDIKLNGIDPSILSYDAAGAPNMDETALHASFVDLLNSNNPDTVALAQDLIAYSYLNGGVQGAVNFIKYIPPAYLTTIGFTAKLREIDRGMDTTSFFGINGVTTSNPYGLPGKFVTQLFQNNPDLLPKLPTETIKEKTPPTVITLNEEDALKHLIIGEGEVSPMFAFYDANSPKKYRVYQIHGYNTDEETGEVSVTYIQVDTAGSNRGITEYNPNQRLLDSSLSKNKAKPITKKEIPESDPKEIVDILSKEKKGNLDPNMMHSNTVYDRTGIAGENTFNGTGTAVAVGAVDSISNNSSNRANKLLAKVIARGILEKNITIDIRTGDGEVMLDSGEKYKVEGAAYQYNLQENKHTVMFNTAEINPSESIVERKILHELTHTLTANEAINGEGKSAQNIRKTYNSLIKMGNEGKFASTQIGNSKYRLDADTISDFKDVFTKVIQGIADDSEQARYKNYLNDEAFPVLYGFYNVKEFVTQAFTEPDFQLFLNTVQYRNSDMTLLGKFLEMVTDFLNTFTIQKTGEKVKENTVLHAALVDIISVMTDSETSINQDKEIAINISPKILATLVDNTYTVNFSEDASDEAKQYNGQSIKIIGEHPLAPGELIGLLPDGKKIQILPNELTEEAPTNNPTIKGGQINLWDIPADIPIINDDGEVIPNKASLFDTGTKPPSKANIPSYTVNRGLKNKDGSKRLASTNGTDISINPVSSIEEFFNYFEGKEGGISSQQKKLVLAEMNLAGFSIEVVRNLLDSVKKINTFLVLHEQDHIDNNDKDVYWKSGDDLLTPDKVTIEARASMNALREVEKLFPNTIDLSPGTQEGNGYFITDEQYKKVTSYIRDKYLKKPKSYIQNGKKYRDNKIYGQVQAQNLARQIEKAYPWLTAFVTPIEEGKAYIQISDNRGMASTSNTIDQSPATNPASKASSVTENDHVLYEEDPREGLVSYLKSRIVSIQKSKAKFQNDPKKVDAFNKRIEVIEKQLENLKQESTISTIIDIGNQELKSMNKLLRQVELGEEDYRYLINHLGALRAAVQFWSTSLDRFLTVEEREPDIITGEESSAVRDLKQLKLDAELLSTKVAKQMRMNLLKVMEDTPGIQEIIKEFDEASFKTMVDIDSGTAMFRDISMSGKPILSAVDKWMRLANARINEEAGLEFAELEKIVKKIKNNSTFKKQGWNLFAQIGEDGKPTGQLVHRFSTSFYAERTRQRKRVEGKKGSKWKKYFEWKKKNEIMFDLRKIFLDDSESSSFTEIDKTAHLAELKATLGEKGFDKYMSEVQDKYDDYTLLREAAYLRIEDEAENPIVAKYQKTVWEMQNSPFEYANQINDGKKNVIKTIAGEEFITPKGWQFTDSVPRKIDTDGNTTSWYDSKYNAIENDPALEDFYNYYISTVRKMFNYLPQNLTEDLNVNTLPELKKSFIEKLYKDKNLKTGFKGMFDGFVEMITSEGDNEVVRQEIDSVTGATEPTFPVTMLEGKMSAEDKSYELDKVLKVFTTMALSYKHKSRVEDQIRLATQVVADAQEIKETAGGKIKKDRWNRLIQEKGALKNIKSQLGHAVDSFYGLGKPVEYVSKTKILSFEEREMKRKANKEIKIITDKLENGTITSEEYDIAHAEINKKYNLDKLGRNLTYSKLGDTVIQYVQLKGMGWNLFSATTNLIYGSMSNFVHAAGRRDFNFKDLRRAFAIMLHSTSSSATLGNKSSGTADKIRSLMVKWDVLKAFNEEAHSNSDNSNQQKKGLQKLNPYELQGSSEYFVQGQEMVAFMLNQQVTDTTGKKRSLWEAFDNSGNWKTKEFGKNTDWNGDLNNDSHNKKKYAFKHRLDQILKLTHGNYDPNSAVRIKRTVLGRFLMQFRSWVAEGVAGRFENEKYDALLERNRKGRYKTMGDLGPIKSITTLLKQATYRKDAFINKDGTAFSEVDKENMRKNLSEISFLIAVTVLGWTLAMLADDEDDEEMKAMYNFWINQGFRLENDIKFFSSPMAFEAITKNAIPAFSVISDVVKFLDASAGLLTGDDEIKQGRSAGESRIIRSIGKTLPFSSQYYKLKTSTEYLFQIK